VKILKSRELCEYLEQLRSARNISQESFTEGIVSLRQYRRYINGESDLPFQVLDLLTERLGIQTINLLREIEYAKIEESKKVEKLYNFMSNNSYDEFNKLYNELKNREFIDHENEIVYKHSVTYSQLKKGLISKETALKMNSELINYPKIMKQTVYTIAEMLVLNSIADLVEPKKESSQILEILKSYIFDDKFATNSNYQTSYNILLFHLSKQYGKNEKYEDVISLCKIGISKNASIRSFYLNDYFYYFLALSYYRLGNFKEYEDSLVSCFNTIQIENNKQKYDKFSNLIQSDFNIDFTEFVIEHYRKTIKNDKENSE